MKMAFTLATILFSLYSHATFTIKNFKPYSRETLPQEVTTVLLDTEYAQLMTQLNLQADQNHLQLRMTAYQVQELENQKRVSLFLASETTHSEDNPTAYGEIQALVQAEGSHFKIVSIQFQPSANSTGQAFPSEMTALWTHPQYSKLVSTLNQKAQAQHIQLQISYYSIVDLQDHKIIYVTLTAQPQDQKTTPKRYGQFVGYVTYNIRNEPVLNSVYFRSDTD